MVALLVILGIVAVAYGFHEISRPPTELEITRDRAHREQAERKRESNRLRSFCNDYRMATQFIPKSKWILMSRVEKSELYATRESLEVRWVYDLTDESRAIAIKEHGVDPKKFIKGKVAAPK